MPYYVELFQSRTESWYRFSRPMTRRETDAILRNCNHLLGLMRRVRAAGESARGRTKEPRDNGKSCGQTNIR